MSREDLFVLHAQADQGVDVEEAPIAEITSGGAPKRQPIVLALEQRVQGIGSALSSATTVSTAAATAGCSASRRASCAPKTSLSRCRRRTLARSVAVDSGKLAEGIGE